MNCVSGASVRDSVQHALEGLGVPRSMVSDLPQLHEDVLGVLLYGSRARKDHTSNSDVDLLAICRDRHPSVAIRKTNLSFYTPEQIQRGRGTLFGAHLQRDAIVIWEHRPNDVELMVRSMGSVDTDRLFRRCRAMASLFRNPERDLPQYLTGLAREARYLLRSAMYATEIARGRMCFSVREIAVRRSDSELVRLLSSHQLVSVTVDRYGDYLSRLTQEIGVFDTNPYRSLEQTVVNEWDSPGDLLSMSFMALGSRAMGDYAEVEKILL